MGFVAAGWQLHDSVLSVRRAFSGFCIISGGAICPKIGSPSSPGKFLEIAYALRLLQDLHGYMQKLGAQLRQIRTTYRAKSRTRSLSHKFRI